MNRSVFFVVGFIIATMLWTSGCTNKNEAGKDSVQDTTFVIDTLPTDTLETLIEETPMPKAADELFDDFFFNFAANKKLQYERVDFPLQENKFGKTTLVDKKTWRMEHFFMRQGFYTLVLGSTKDIKGAKDTKVEHVLVEKIHLDKNYIQQYVFNRVEGLWKLQQLNSESTVNNKNGEFYTFYDKFVNDSTFRVNAMAESVDFSGPDPEDDFSRMEGSIMPEQWSMFAPELPKDIIYNITYGDHHTNSSQRILVIRGIANGFETELTFKKSPEGYKLVKLTM